ncbi:MAG: TIGR02391 family protein [Candidatus Woesebacteria bacterium]|nr:TIGR02391 family protein [Candidatus Woesebacteria bacterium]
MATRKPPPQPQIEPRVWQSPQELDKAVAKLHRRIAELDGLNVQEAVLNDTGADDVVVSDFRTTVLELFGENSPEYREHKHMRMWAGPMYVNMEQRAIVEGTERGRLQMIGILKGLEKRLLEKREDLADESGPTPKEITRVLNLHPRIADVAADLFEDGYHWEAVFAAAKALVNFVKERSGQHQLDGSGLMRTVFSRNNPILSFNELQDQTDLDEQEGMMHLFEGAVLGIRNPGGHSFPEGPDQRAAEYLSLLSLLAYRTQEAKRRKVT